MEKWLILGFFMLLTKESLQQKKHNCREFEENDLLNADCKGEGLTEVPQDLNPLIKVLDLSKNPFILEKLQEQVFERYTILIKLIMYTNLQHPDYYLFRSLKVLESLDYEHAEGVTVLFYWPPSLKELKLGYGSLRDLDILNLRNLEYLDVNHNYLLHSFPLFNELAAVKYINLNATILQRMSAEDLAHLCHLEEIVFGILTNYEKYTDLFNELRYCECIRLQTWLTTYHIKAGILPCTPPRAGNKKCNLEFSSDMLESRSECLSRTEGTSIFKYLGVLLIILVVIAIPSVAGYLYYTKRKEETDEETEITEDPNET